NQTAPCQKAPSPSHAAAGPTQAPPEPAARNTPPARASAHTPTGSHWPSWKSPAATASTPSSHRKAAADTVQTATDTIRSTESRQRGPHLSERGGGAGQPAPVPLPCDEQIAVALDPPGGLGGPIRDSRTPLVCQPRHGHLARRATGRGQLTATV